MITKFDEFRDSYLEYIQEYNNYKFLPHLKELIGLSDDDPINISNHISGLAQLQTKTGLLAKQLMAQIKDTFSNSDDKVAYLKSIKTFILDEFENWDFREPEKKYEWQKLYQEDRIYREWMPDYLYDILAEVERVQGKMKPEEKKVKESKKGTKTDERKLEDIWLKGKDHYDKVINFLKDTPVKEDTDKMIVTEIKKVLFWNGGPTLLGAFIYQCKKTSENGPFIHSAPTLPVSNLECILNRTFSGLKLRTAKPLQEGSRHLVEKHKKIFKRLEEI